MKHLYKKCGQAAIGLGLVAASLGFATSSYAEIATGTISVTLLKTITIAKPVAMNFGTVVLDTTAAKVVTLSTAGSLTVDTGELISAGAYEAAGVFDIAGTPSQAISISVAKGNDPQLDDGTTVSTLAIGTIVTDAIASPVLDSGGDLQLKVGMSLTIPASANQGTYTGGTYTVTANYP